MLNKIKGGVAKHNGTKHILKDAIRDRDGNYHDDIIYEIVKEDF